jgi:hypothetical protein
LGMGFRGVGGKGGRECGIGVRTVALW